MKLDFKEEETKAREDMLDAIYNARTDQQGYTVHIPMIEWRDQIIRIRVVSDELKKLGTTYLKMLLSARMYKVI